jgi:long-chain acyl-CoA synthetase
LYTAGTTGEPKGVVLSHSNMVSNVNAVRALFPITCEDNSLAFLPWAHAFGQTCELHMLTSYGCAIAINDEVPNLVGNLAEVKPSILISVPRIFNRIYDGVNKQMQDKPAPIRALFQRAIRAATERSRGKTLGLLDKAALALANKLIFNKIRARMGGRLRYAVSGSAALSREVGEFVDALGIEVYEGYGLTETSPVASVNYPEHRRMGSVGQAIPGVRIEIDTHVTGDPENGEIVVHGPCVMQGYHNRPKETGEVLTADHGLRTGDMGRLDADGYLFITGRIKEQYKLENGKYVVPSVLEETLKLSPYIVNIMLFGHNKPHNVALVVADVEAIKKWANAKHHTLGELAKDPAVQQLITQELAHYSADFKGFERPSKFALITEDFTVENGMLTPKLSLKRRKVLEKYGSLLESLYAK